MVQYQGRDLAYGPTFFRLENLHVDKELASGGSCYNLRSCIRRYVSLNACIVPSYINLFLVCAFVTTWETIVIPEFASFQKFRVSEPPIWAKASYSYGCCTKGVVIVWLACAVAADITITTILVWHL